MDIGCISDVGERVQERKRNSVELRNGKMNFLQLNGKNVNSRGYCVALTLKMTKKKTKPIHMRFIYLTKAYDSEFRYMRS